MKQGPEASEGTANALYLVATKARPMDTPSRGFVRLGNVTDQATQTPFRKLPSQTTTDTSVTDSRSPVINRGNGHSPDTEFKRSVLPIAPELQAEIATINAHLAQTTPSGEKPSREDLANLKEAGVILGFGREKIVIDSHSNPTEVIALPYVDSYPNDASNAKIRYYSSKIFSTLFPYNFPAMVASYGRQETETQKDGIDINNGGYVMKKIFPTENPAQQSEHPMEEVYQFYEELGLPIVMDWNGENYLPGKDGGTYFVDFVASREFSQMAENDLSDWMDSHMVTDKNTSEEREYTLEEEKSVVHALRRLKSLHSADPKTR